MPVKKLKNFLDENDVKYVTITHSRAFTSQEIAALSHVSGRELAKTVMIKIDNKMAMAVLPASYHIDFESLQTLFGTKNVRLANESEFENRFPDCEVGAMPPFGNLYDIEVIVAESLTVDEEIAFNAGSHTELIKLSYDDYFRLVKPRILKFSGKTISFPHDPRERWSEN
jgi:Ala-tRNA(Pro) deacylase